MTTYATPEGTAAYKTRFPNLAEGHFRQKEGLWFSSLGIGSYLGEPDEATDRFYEEALEKAVLSGINVIDSAINYRSQRSERSFGRALSALFKSGKVKREEVILCTKGGFIPFDNETPADAPGYLKKTYIQTGILKPEEIAQGCHAMSPKYLEDQLQRSLQNLQVETLDIYYLHNPETQLAELEQADFLNRMRAAFDWCEKKVKEGKIRMYGTATWTGYRVEREANEYLSLQELNVAAREVGGAENHFKVIQLPFNLAMPEAWVFPNQSFGANLVSLLNVAERSNKIVIGSASLLQARLTGPLPENLEKYFGVLKKSSQRALQFARSVPGITTALVGMKSGEHVAENMETAKVPPLSENELILMFSV
jgi:aryl-alcohol dehydrogenase-like predicted oxidoreductase